MEIGRRDTYPLIRERETYAAAAPTEEDDEDEDDAERRRRESRFSDQRPGRELQVYEAWIKVQVKPKGLRCVAAVFS